MAFMVGEKGDMQVVGRCPADSLPLGYGLVVQEACLGLGSLLGALASAETAELSPNAAAAFQSQAAAFRCWHSPPPGAHCHSMGECLAAAWHEYASPQESRFLLAVGLLFGWPAIVACSRPCMGPVPWASA